jgi:hypothetical protein
MQVSALLKHSSSDQKNVFSLGPIEIIRHLFIREKDGDNRRGNILFSLLFKK